jgi:hypothetical protein
MSKLVCEICEERTEILLINHHIQSRSKGGIDHPSNIACLCRSCHEHVHHGLIIIEGRFNSNVGNIVVYHKWNESYVIKEVTPEVWLYPDAKIYKLKFHD